MRQTHASTIACTHARREGMSVPVCRSACVYVAEGRTSRSCLGVAGRFVNELVSDETH